MALNDDDKKFIKKTVDDAVDKKTTSFEKSAANEKSSRLKAQIEERKERQAYLKQLKELQTNGDATMAQKFELMKEEINSKISQDIKDTVKTTMDTVGKGANAVGRGVGKATSGVDSLITRMASINPILAALYSGTKGVTRDIWNIGAGSVQAALGGAQMAWGAGKAAVGLVGSTMNSMRNMYLKRKAKNQPQQEPEMEMETPLPATPQEEQQEQPNLELPSLLPEQESTSESLKDMQKRIKEIHEATVKGKKEQEDGMKSQLKSLAGMQKTMQMVNQVMAVLKTKQALIVTGVTLGAAAIVALLIWLRNRFKNQIYNPTNNPDGLTLTPTDNADKSNKLKEQSESTNTGNETNDELVNKIKQSGGIKQSDYTKFTNKKDKEISQLHNEGKITKSQYQLMVGATGGVGGKRGYIGSANDLNSELTEFTGETETNVIQFPVPTKVLYKNDATGDSAIVVQNTKNKERITVSNILELIANLNQEYPPNTPLAIAGGSYKISGNLKKFLNDQSYEENINKNKNNNWETTIQQLNEQRTEKDIKKKQKQEKKDSKERQNDVDFWKRFIKKDKKETVTGGAAPIPTEIPNEVDDFEGTTAPDNKVTTIPKTKSENEQKVNNTSKELTEETQPKKPEPQKEEKLSNNTQKQNMVIASNTSSGTDIYSNQLTAFQYGLTARQQNTIT